MEPMKHLLAALGLLLLLVPSIARGQAPSPSDADRVTARALAHEGYDAELRGDHAHAADCFRRADALVPAPTLLLGLARAQVGLRKLVEAHETYWRVVRTEIAPDAPAPFARAVDDAKRELAALEPRLSWVTIDVIGPKGPGVTMTLDGAPFPTTALGTRRASDPGLHRVRISAPSFAPAESTFTAAEGEATVVSLAPEALPEAATPATPTPLIPHEVPAAAPNPPSTTAGKTIGVVLLGLGTVGLVGGAVTGVLASTKHASLIGGCPGGHCPSSVQSQVDTYDTLGMASTLSLAAGAACAVAGLAFILTSRSTPVTAYVGFLDAGIRGTF